jgi:phosphatidate cytidylyltransferase
MLRTRLWMGALLIVLVVAVLCFDPAPWYPFLLALLLLLGAVGGIELYHLLGAARGVPLWQIVPSVLVVLLANWPAHFLPKGNPWLLILGTFAAVVLAAFLFEMARFTPAEGVGPGVVKGGQPGDVVVRIALVTWMVAYLGVLPSFLAQLRWKAADAEAQAGTGALLLAVFVPKCCDIGAYFTGRLLGRHRMSPVLSPKKTWEGLAGGLVLSMAAAAAINRFLSVLPVGDLPALGFGLTLGIAGTLGDLAESLVKRDCRSKDASAVVPGFGGVLDVIDAILFAAPVAYFWLRGP